MKYRILITICLLTLLPIYILAQTTNNIKQNELEKYSRSSLTSILLKLKDDNKYKTFIEREFYNTSIPNKFFENKIEPRVIAIDTLNRFISASEDLFKIQTKISKSLNQNKYDLKVIESWFNRNSKGEFDLSKFMERGLYSATDNEYIQSKAMARGIGFLYDLASNLIDNNYLLVLGFEEIRTVEELYQLTNAPRAARKEHGFKGKVHGFLFKINFPARSQNIFFNEIWIDKSTPIDSISIRKQRFEKFKLEVIPDTIISVYAESKEKNELRNDQKQKTYDELFHDFISNSIHDIINLIEFKKKEFQVNSNISTINPIGIKVGTKEGLEFDQRYYVYENILINNKVEANLVGSIRAYNINDNSKNTTGNSNPSLFYQTFGRKIDDQGMYVVQKNSSGGFTGGNLMVGGLKNLAFKVEFPLGAKIGNKKLKRGQNIQNPHFLKSFRSYLEMSYGRDENSGSYFGSSFGFIKDIFLTPNLFISPQIGFGWDLPLTKEKDGSAQIEGGLDLGISISPSTRFFIASKAFLPPWTNERPSNLPFGIGIGFRKELMHKSK